MSITLTLENKPLGFALGFDLSFTYISIPCGLTMLSTAPLTDSDEEQTSLPLYFILNPSFECTMVLRVTSKLD
jgi:hypothetical protein